MKYVVSKCSLVKLDDIEGFPKQIEDGSAIHVFWMNGNFEFMSTSDIQELYEMGCGISEFDNDDSYVHPAMLWEMCQTWNVPYPAEYMKTFEAKIVKENRLSGFQGPKLTWEWMCDNIEDYDDRNNLFFVWMENAIKVLEEESTTLEEVMDSLIPRIHTADTPERKRSHFRAVYDMLLMEKKMYKVYLDAFKLGLARLTSSSC